MVTANQRKGEGVPFERIRRITGYLGGWQTGKEPQTDDEWRKVTIVWGRNTYEGLVCAVEHGTDRMTVQIEKILPMAEANHV